MLFVTCIEFATHQALDPRIKLHRDVVAVCVLTDTKDRSIAQTFGAVSCDSQSGNNCLALFLTGKHPRARMFVQISMPYLMYCASDIELNILSARIRQDQGHTVSHSAPVSGAAHRQAAILRTKHSPYTPRRGPHPSSYWLPNAPD
jgi:hypothetical protein